MVVKILQGYFVFAVLLMVVYSIRHFRFTYNRLFSKQRVSYRDMYDSDLPRVTVMIPMHNEEAVVANVMESLLQCDYDMDKFEIIAIDDHSDDNTPQIVDSYHEQYPFIKVIHRTGEGERGKPVGLNDALKIATGEVIVSSEAAWNQDGAVFARAEYPWFVRGGYFGYGLMSGPFLFVNVGGSGSIDMSARAVLVSLAP